VPAGGLRRSSPTMRATPDARSARWSKPGRPATAKTRRQHDRASATVRSSSKLVAAAFSATRPSSVTANWAGATTTHTFGSAGAQPAGGPPRPPAACAIGRAQLPLNTYCPDRRRARAHRPGGQAPLRPRRAGDERVAGRARRAAGGRARAAGGPPRTRRASCCACRPGRTAPRPALPDPFRSADDRRPAGRPPVVETVAP
jgi:hypothetical protein